MHQQMTFRERRKALGYTQSKLAAISGVEQSVISRIERAELQLRKALNIGEGGLL